MGSRAPCGCRKRAQASVEPDDEDRRQLELDADEAAREWRCPRVRGAPEEPLDDAHTEALDAVQRVTGHRFKTCPMAGTWEPWLHRVVDADERGLAEDRAAYGPPPRALVDAVRVVRRARAARDAEERRVAKEKDD